MKKLIVLSFICSAVAISCGKKIMPGSDANNQSKTANDKSAKSATTATNTNASATTTPSFNNMQNSVPPVQSNPRSASMEEGKSVFVSKCTKCHALKAPGDYTYDRWNEILKSMVPKAKLNSDEEANVTAYLLANAKK